MTRRSTTNPVRLRRAILAWYEQGHRSLPWRGSRDPYAVLVSEVMLQQTQASRVAVRYPRFMTRFPDLAALASASEADVLAEWSGLGYNRRALALRDAAVAVQASGWPSDLAGLQRLPGVGPYTARAIGSLAFGWRVGVVDTNVRRWLVRRLGLEPGSGAAGGGALQRLADDLANAGHAAPEDGAAWTHASMELGAVICRAQVPACNACPIASGCPARGSAGRVPVPRQGPFRGSRRAYRGGVMRALAAAPEYALRIDATRARTPSVAAPEALDGRLEPRLMQEALEGLERDGLAHLDGSLLRLGPRPARGSSGGPRPTIAR